MQEFMLKRLAYFHFFPNQTDSTLSYQSSLQKNNKRGRTEIIILYRTLKLCSGDIETLINKRFLYELTSEENLLTHKKTLEAGESHHKILTFLSLASKNIKEISECLVIAARHRRFRCTHIKINKIKKCTQIKNNNLHNF